MGPKKIDSSGKVSKLGVGATGSYGIGGGTTGEPEYQKCVGKFAIDLEICCREPPPSYPVMIPVYVRGRQSFSSQTQSSSSQTQQQQQSQQQPQQPRSRPHSRVSATPSALGGAIGEEQSSTTTGKKAARPRKTSTSQSGNLIVVTDVDNDTQTLTNTVIQEASTTVITKTSVSPYRTFHLLNDGDYFRPKLLVDLVNNESETIEQITVLYMKDWKLDQRFIDILKRMLPLQEHLHTLNLCYVALQEQTIIGLVELCHLIKSLKSLSLDGNPQAGDHFYRLIDKEDSKILHLSLRYCDIKDTGAERLANALGNISTQNWKLLTLDLSGNRIGDGGATSLAAALRYNRTLMSLNLSSNLITDKGALPLTLVLRRIVLTPEEIVRRRYLIAERYAEMHPDDSRYNMSSPTPSNVSTKSKSNRNDWKRLEANKRKPNAAKIAQLFTDKRNRNDSDDSRPSSRNKAEPKPNRNEGSAGGRSSAMNNGGRSSALNNPSATAPRRTVTNPSNTNSKDSDPSRASAAPARTKKAAAGTSAATKKNISIVKEEEEHTSGGGRPTDLSSSGKLIGLQVHPADHENPLMDTNDAESHDGQLWLRGNVVLTNLNLSRNYLTNDSVKEFLLSIQQQSALTKLNDTFNSSASATATASSLIDFSGLCRLELKGMSEISTKSAEYQSLETLLAQRNPTIRFQQYKEREAAREAQEAAALASQHLHSTLSDKPTNTLEKARAGSSLKMAVQRPTSRLKD